MQYAEPDLCLSVQASHFTDEQELCVSSPEAWPEENEHLNKLFASNELRQLASGRLIKTNDKIYRVCAECGKLVRLNKPIIGSMHICKE